MNEPVRTVTAGSLVTLRLAGRNLRRFLIADQLPIGDDADIETCPPRSPFGQAIRGSTIGDRFTYLTPSGKSSVLVDVIAIEREWALRVPRRVQPVQQPQQTVMTTTAALPMLTPEQQMIVDRVESGTGNFFVTGRAGTGKSTILRHLVQRSAGTIPVVAPTGVAAVNVGGVTINSFFELPLGVIADVELEQHHRPEVLRAADVVIIDEISMVSADMIDAIDRRMRDIRRRPNVPFGGARLIMFGDPYQLPPVPTDDPDAAAYLADSYRSQWFFDAKAWRQSPIAVLELMEIHRQRDGEFRDLLNAVRYRTVTAQQAGRLNAAGARPVPNDTITLATTNATVTRINAENLARLPGAAETRVASVEGDFPNRAFPTDFELRVKVGARVMLVQNDGQGKRWVNGELGTVVEIRTDSMRIAVDGGEVHDVDRVTWQRVRYEYSSATRKLKRAPVGSFTQFPVRLAWAATIHRSQGRTLERAIIDLGDRAFAAGQAYVALSRLTSLDGVYLTRNLQPSDVIVDPRVAEFMPAPTDRNATRADAPIR